MSESTQERIEASRKSGRNIPVRIEIEYEDGSIVGASGTDAFEISCAWWDWCERLAFVYGILYDGPTLKLLRAVTPGQRETADHPGEQ
jgi:hypothetical protein